MPPPHPAPLFGGREVSLIFKFKSSLKTSAIAFHAVVFGVHEPPCSTGRSSKGQLAVVEPERLNPDRIFGTAIYTLSVIGDG